MANTLTKDPTVGRKRGEREQRTDGTNAEQTRCWL